jgi:hypothetical protein
LYVNQYAWHRTVLVPKASKNKTQKVPEATQAAAGAGAELAQNPLVAEIPTKMINQPFISLLLSQNCIGCAVTGGLTLSEI